MRAYSQETRLLSERLGNTGPRPRLLKSMRQAVQASTKAQRLGKVLRYLARWEKPVHDFGLLLHAEYFGRLQRPKAPVKLEARSPPFRLFRP
eukprot:6180773-Pleurochrysis_carterae.AAC.2